MRFFDHMNEIKKKKFIAKRQNQIFDYISNEVELQTLISSISRFQYNTLLSYLRDLLFNLKGADAVRLKNIFAEPKLLNYIFRLLRSWKKKKRIKAIYYLRYINKPEVVELLMKELESSNELIFKTTLESLAYLNSAEKINQILDLVLKQKNINADMMLTLINNFDDSICPIIAERLVTEKSNILLQVIITFLAHHKYIDASSKVLSVLIRAKDDKVALEAVNYLGEIEDPNSLQMLKMGLNSSKPEIRIASIKAVSKIGVGSLEDQVIERFHDTQLAVKLAAAQVLLKYSDKGKKLLFDLSNSDSDSVEVTIAKRVFMERRIS
jgi:HEAT repeat protein